MKTALVTHHNADLDALASLIAAARLYPEATPLRGRSVSPPVQRYLALHKDHFPLRGYNEVDLESFERLVVVDVRDRRRLKEYEPLLATDPEIIVFDHHPPGPHDLPAARAQVEPTGACVTLLIERLRAQAQEGDEDGEGAVSAAEATLMLLGLYADTGRLSFASTHPRDVDAAAWLMRRGASLAVVNRYLREEFSTAQRQLLIEMLGQTEETSVDAVEIAISTARFPRYVRGASAVVHRIMQMGGHDAIFGVIHFEKDRRVQVIGRSRVPYVDIGALMAGLGGGGHPGAGACTFKKTPIEDVLAQLHALIAQTPLRPTRVEQMMTSPVQTVDHRTTLAELSEVLEHLCIKGVPVLREDALSGVISRRDLERAQRQGAEMSLPVSAMMTHEVETIAPDEPIEDAMEVMTAADIGRLPVVDPGDGRLLGIISRTDLIARLYGDEDPAQAEE